MEYHKYRGRSELELICFFGFGGSVSQKARSILEQRRGDAIALGMELVDQPAILKDVANGKKFGKGVRSDVGELSAARQELKTLVVCNRTYFGSSGEIFSPLGDIYPLAANRAKYFAHALKGFSTTIILDLDLLPIFFLRFAGVGFKMAVDTLSRTQLLELSWVPVVQRVVTELHDSRIILVGANPKPQNFEEALHRASANFPSALARSDINDDSRKSTARLPGDISGISIIGQVSLFQHCSGQKHDENIEICISKIARHLEIHHSIIIEMIRNYFKDIDEIKNFSSDALDTTCL